MVPPDDEPDAPRSILRDPTRLIEADERIETVDYRAEYPPVPASRSEYLHRPRSAGGGDARVHVGTTVDGYRIRRQIGRGGMGVVYEAEQVSLGRPVALKVLPHGSLRHQRAVDRFRREATAVARLSHPRIVAVHGFGIAEGIAYLAMEFVEGLDLGEIVDRLKSAQLHGRRFVRISGPDLDQDITEWAQGRKLIGTVPGDPRIREGIVIDLRNHAPMCAALIADVADALRHAHAHGVIHRDIKPSNLILGREGRLKLSDFGLAKDTSTRATLTQSGDFVGSPAYVSPEQAEQRRRKVDERSDIYSLGVTLYELLTLHQPFAGKNVAVVLRNIITKDPPPPTRINPRIPKDLETIVLKAIEKDPDRRYQSAEEFGDDLRRFLNFEPIAARPLGPLARAARHLRRHATTASIATMGLAVAVLSLVLWLQDGGAGAERTVAGRLQDELSRRDRVDYGSLGMLELIQLMAEGSAPSERPEQILAIVRTAEEELVAGRYHELSNQLVRLDALTGFGDTGTLDRLLVANIRSIKIGLVRALREELADEPDATTRRRWLAVVERLLEDPDWQVCLNAAAALGEVGRSSSLGALMDALARREDERGRVAILSALGTVGTAMKERTGVVDADLLLLLEESLQDPEPWVRFAAFEALDALDPDGFVDLASSLLPSPDRILRARARWALRERQTSPPSGRRDARGRRPAGGAAGRPAGGVAGGAAEDGG